MGDVGIRIIPISKPVLLPIDCTMLVFIALLFLSIASPICCGPSPFCCFTAKENGRATEQHPNQRSEPSALTAPTRQSFPPQQVIRHEYEQHPRRTVPSRPPLPNRPAQVASHATEQPSRRSTAAKVATGSGTNPAEKKTVWHAHSDSGTLLAEEVPFDSVFETPQIRTVGEEHIDP